MLQKEVLSNGVRVVTENISYVQSVALGIWVNVGSRDEEVELHGISHVIEHMLFKGTATRTAQQIADEIDMIGGDINAFTSKENTCYYVRVLSEHVLVALDVLSDMFHHSLIDTEELAREQNVILEEIKRRDDEPDDLVHDVFTEILWPEHPLGKSVIGTSETVSALKSQDLKDYIAKKYTPDSIVIAVAGNCNHDEIVSMVQQKFGALAGAQCEWRSPTSSPSATKAVKYIAKPIEQVNLVMGVAGYSQLSEEKYAVSVLDNVLGGSMSSRLFQEVREKRGLAYSVGSFTQSFCEGGYLGIYAGTGADTAQEVIAVCHEEVQKMLASGITAKELIRAKNQFRGGIVMGQESMSSRMMRIGRNELVYNRVIPIPEIMECVESVTLEDVARVAEFLFRGKEFAMATVGPFENAGADSENAKEAR